MAIFRKLNGHVPRIGKNVFLAETAVLVGDVTMGDDCSIWYGAVLRGDVNSITLGDRVNIQDGVVIHTLYGQSKTQIGNDVTVGHNAVVHGARIEDNCLIGIGSTLLDNAVVGTGCIVAANALVTANSILEPNGVYAGVPARRVRDVTPEQRSEMIERIARDYIMYASWYNE